MIIKSKRHMTFGNIIIHIGDNTINTLAYNKISNTRLFKESIERELIEVIDVIEVIEEVIEVDMEAMTKTELDNYALSFGIKLDKRKRLSSMIKTFREARNGMG